jgi:hypothetical protein
VAGAFSRLVDDRKASCPAGASAAPSFNPPSSASRRNCFALLAGGAEGFRASTPCLGTTGDLLDRCGVIEAASGSL